VVWWQSTGRGQADWLALRPNLPLALLAVLPPLILVVAAAALRCFEYDETYTHFFASGIAMPDWPRAIVGVGEARSWFDSHQAGFGQVTRDLVAYDTHPPLYFWLIILWRDLVGPDHLATRAFSVLCFAAAIPVAWYLARLARVPPVPAIACTFLSYALLYPATLARAYSLAELLVLLGAAGLALVLRQDRTPDRAPRLAIAAASGFALGLAGFSHYLASITAGGLLGAFGLMLLLQRRLLAPVMAGLGFLPPLLAIIAMRSDQLTEDWYLEGFEPRSALQHMLETQAAALFARTPVWLDPPWRCISEWLIGIAGVIVFATIISRARSLLRDRVQAALVLAAFAIPTGLLLLAIWTDHAPFVSRYFAFGLPFLVFSFAAALGHVGVRRPGLAGVLGAYVLFWQAVGAGSQVLVPATQQEFRTIVAEAADYWKPGAVLAIPIGYDSVGKNGPYLWEAPSTWDMRIIRPTHLPGPAPEDPAVPVAQFADRSRVLLVTFVEDQGQWALDGLRPALLAAGWHKIAEEPYLEVWDH
jgi:hypothetical protein